jgi:hypothetical protein
MHPNRYSGNPFIVFARRPLREQRIRGYILREHRSGRRLAEILRDSHLERLGSRSQVWRTVMDPLTIEALGHDVRLACGNESSLTPRVAGSEGMCPEEVIQRVFCAR